MHLQGSKFEKKAWGKHPLHLTLSSLIWKTLHWEKNHQNLLDIMPSIFSLPGHHNNLCSSITKNWTQPSNSEIKDTYSNSNIPWPCSDFLGKILSKFTGHHGINTFITWSSQQPMELHYEEVDIQVLNHLTLKLKILKFKDTLQLMASAIISCFQRIQAKYQSINLLTSLQLKMITYKSVKK